VAIVFLVETLVAGHDHLAGVDHHDVIARVNVGRELRLVLAAQAVGNLGSQAAQNFVISINHEPVALNFMRFCGKGFHDPPLHRGQSRKAGHFNCAPRTKSNTVCGEIAALAYNPRHDRLVCHQPDRRRPVAAPAAGDSAAAGLALAIPARKSLILLVAIALYALSTPGSAALLKAWK
jgi:hypothetical protein